MADNYVTPLQNLSIPSASVVVSKLASEGIPVAVIARGLSVGVSDVYDELKHLLEIGAITEMPVADWPPTSRRADRLPTFMARESEASQSLLIERVLKLTRLEAAFMLVLLRRDEADKDTLHHVIETQRTLRRSRPDNPETTDPKMVDVIICHLRRKLKPFNVVIRTLWGHGYYLESDSRAHIEHVLAVASKGGTAESVPARASNPRGTKAASARSASAA